MIKEKLCRQVLRDSSLNSLAYNLSGQNKKDLIQELCLIICEKEDEELSKMDSYFNFWCVRTLINITGTRGSFTKKYRPHRLVYEDVKFDSELDYDKSVDELLDSIEGILNKIEDSEARGWYKRRLFKLYLDCGSLRKVEKEVGINYSSVYLTVKEVKEKIKKEL